jgi:hypothetical protein
VGGGRFDFGLLAAPLLTDLHWVMGDGARGRSRLCRSWVYRQRGQEVFEEVCELCHDRLPVERRFYVLLHLGQELWAAMLPMLFVLDHESELLPGAKVSVELRRDGLLAWTLKPGLRETVPKVLPVTMLECLTRLMGFVEGEQKPATHPETIPFPKKGRTA